MSGLWGRQVQGLEWWVVRVLCVRCVGEGGPGPDPLVPGLRRRAGPGCVPRPGGGGLWGRGLLVERGDGGGGGGREPRGRSSILPDLIQGYG